MTCTLSLFYFYAGCRYVEYHYAECHGAILEHTQGYININEIVVGGPTRQFLQIFITFKEH
jgi:hypothetical protein